jgi:hypothetical protein
MPTAAWSVAPGDLDSVARAAAALLTEWRVRSPFVAFWTQTTAERCSDGDVVRCVLDYDNDGLLSFDAFVGDQRLYGADDWVG